MNWRSLTFRLVALYSGLLLLLGVTFYIYTVENFRKYTEETIRANVAGRANEIWQTIQERPYSPRALSALMERRFAPEVQDRFIRISGPSGIRYVSGPPAHHAFDPAKVPLSKPSAHLRRFENPDLFLVAHAYQEANGDRIIIESGQSGYFMKGVEGSLGASLLVGLPVLLLIAGAGGYVLIRRALAPVELMITAAEAISFNDPHKRLPPAGSGDRIEALAVALNRMLDRLDAAYQHVNRFSADAAHELRTPLAIIRGELEFVGSSRNLSPEIENSVSNVLEEVARLSDVVDSLITLSRMDSFWGKRTHANVDLNALATETVEQMQLLAEEKNIVLEGPTAAPVIVAGDRDRLKQVLVNLIDNAIKYSPRASWVGVSVELDIDAAVLAVADSGPGIPEEAQNLVFDRFYRVSTDRGETGAGLGLAIVKAICNAHGGKVIVQSDGRNGSRFVVRLPLHEKLDD